MNGCSHTVVRDGICTACGRIVDKPFTPGITVRRIFPGGTR
jgi:hypothetical protein